MAAFAADWTVYTPEGLPPLVQDAYPGKGVQLHQARQAGPQPSATARTLVDALVMDWVGPGARWFARLGNDAADALAVSQSGLKVLAVHLGSPGQPGALAFELKLQVPLVPARAFVPAADESPLWTRRLPVTQKTFSGDPCPEGIELGWNGVTVTTRANFPLPGGKRLVQELRCAGLEITVRGGGQYSLAEQMTVRAATWQQAWALVAPSPLVSLLSPGSFTVVNGTATVSRRSPGAYVVPDDVIAVQTSTGLQPILFQQRLTPWPLGDGENRFYLNTLGSAWDYVSIDTRAGLVVLIRTQAFPKF